MLLGLDLQRAALDDHVGFVEQTCSTLGSDPALSAGDDIDLIGPCNGELVNAPTW